MGAQSDQITPFRIEPSPAQERRNELISLHLINTPINLPCNEIVSKIHDKDRGKIDNLLKQAKQLENKEDYNQLANIYREIAKYYYI